jgi:NAD(P)-dependent dehydrogenase (short-subunit alcohol dehydrogenase family)
VSQASSGERAPTTALVVGGASGIGRACALDLVRAGWSVSVADLKTPDDPGTGIERWIALDVRDRDAVRRGVEEVSADGPLGAVVYAAGTARVTPISEIESREWDLVVGVNLTGAFHVIQESARAMTAGGSIIVISSIDARSPVEGLAHYCAAKAGLEGLVRSAALELGARNIRCNAVAPGVVRTPLMAPMLKRPEVEDAFLAQIPLRRIAESDDIAGTVTFLASPVAAWVTGTCIPVDGGMSLREHPRLLPA